MHTKVRRRQSLHQISPFCLPADIWLMYHQAQLLVSIFLLAVWVLAWISSALRNSKEHRFYHLFRDLALLMPEHHVLLYIPVHVTKEGSSTLRWDLHNLDAWCFGLASCKLISRCIRLQIAGLCSGLNQRRTTKLTPTKQAVNIDIRPQQFCPMLFKLLSRIGEYLCRTSNYLCSYTICTSNTSVQAQVAQPKHNCSKTCIIWLLLNAADYKCSGHGSQLDRDCNGVQICNAVIKTWAPGKDRHWTLSSTEFEWIVW